VLGIFRFLADVLHMKNHFLICLILWAFLAMTSSCVSVKLPTAAGTPAEDVVYSEPPAPFSEIKLSSGDKAWLSSATGNTLSFLSDCHGRTDPTLEQLASEPLAALEKLKILSSRQTPYNGREAQITEAQGEMDGVPVKTLLLVFKKNNCNYTLSYGGLSKNFDTEKKYFEKFTESFKAP